MPATATPIRARPTTYGTSAVAGGDSMTVRSTFSERSPGSASAPRGTDLNHIVGDSDEATSKFVHSGAPASAPPCISSMTLAIAGRAHHAGHGCSHVSRALGLTLDLESNDDHGSPPGGCESYRATLMPTLSSASGGSRIRTCVGRANAFTAHLL